MHKQTITKRKLETSRVKYPLTNIISSVAEKIASLKTEDYLMQRAERGSRAHALTLLNQVSDSPAEKQDQL